MAKYTQQPRFHYCLPATSDVIVGVEIPLPIDARQVLADFARVTIDDVEPLVDAHMVELTSQLRADPSLSSLLAPELVAAGRAVARVDLLHELGALQDGAHVPSECPPEVTETARRAAQFGAPVAVPLQAYRSGHRVLWGALRRYVSGRDLKPDAREAALESGSAFLFAYADRCCHFLIGEYTERRDEIVRSSARARVTAVGALLGGGEPDPSLDYRFDQQHVALIASGADANELVQRFGRGLSAEVLIVELDHDTAWAWLGGTSWPVGGPSLQAAPATIAMTCGSPGHGVAGFRRSHREAGRAMAVLRPLGLTCARYADVWLEALALADEITAQDLVEGELARLEPPGARHVPLRETLLAYFASEQNAAATAALLGVHERTVAYRLRLVEERLGYRVNSRRAELETALRIGPATEGGAPERGPTRGR